MDRFQEMKVFVAIVDCGSFVGAADMLGLSKAAVSRTLNELESRLGVRLLNRTTRRLSLTGEGATFHIRSKAVLADVDEAEAEITAGTGEARGPLKINAPVTFGLLHLAPLWGGFMAQHPAVMLDITLADRLVDVVEEGYDLVIRVGRLRSSSLISRQLSSTRMVLCASPRYLDEHGRPTEPAELASHSILAYSLFSMGDQWAFTGPDGPVSVNVNPRMRTNSGDTCRDAALQHMGIILQPSFLVGDDLRSGALEEIMPNYRSIELGVYALYPSRQHVSPKVRLLIDYLRQALGGRTW
ncbi:LysR family transcriptional regulator [Pusillimonas sp. TS35]|uniref:LysR family transcriptional regulator n=1 Tax=Paracandidimonas lactea TaxID=2895524 RepID=UPI00136851B2|nr:LysR family transcriptional regulator [Paracandidimonas lactea]MYN12826.1 LysR family transcriptional regulator [Pusillimonas sp. TS35]